MLTPLVIAAMTGLTPPPVKILPEAPIEKQGAFRLDAGAGAFAPVGRWADHVYGDHIQQFGAGPRAQLDLSLAILATDPDIFLGIGVDYQRLSTRQWVQFAAERGDEVVADAHLLGYYFMFGVVLPLHPHLSIEPSIGGGVLNPWGGERIRGTGFEFPYTFVHTAGAVRGVVAGLWTLTDWFLMRLSVEFLGGFGGVRYFGEDTRSIMGATASLGIRLVP